MILISSCMAGLATRYDGNDAHVEQLDQLLQAGKAVLVCPEQLGGLPTPRPPAEIVGGDGYDVLDGKASVIDINGCDVTEEFLKGAQQTLKLALSVGAKQAVLKEHSPSCGSSFIYNGTFRGEKKDGVGVTTALLERNGIRVISEDDIDLDNL
ncbi:DUF523 domain-containing protein [Brevibacillus humidisoli]|uniref:DUF523 domain-containing protein n=1 Tax=Brevibacillus humidisoli TaxID=2895522 RepID=UPI001E494CDF|nr:DUF523 domain-containing protein [Brevibacillus humidisoli]UFJ40267.1 DUF523 domain-containing protein [Brevibacillus humidisoli]